MRRSISYALIVAALVTSTSAIPAQQRAQAAAAPLAPRMLPAGRYEFTSTDDDGDISAGTVSWIGQKMRIDMDSKTERRRGNRRGAAATVNVSSRRDKGDYILVDFATNTVRTRWSTSSKLPKRCRPR